MLNVFMNMRNGYSVGSPLALARSGIGLKSLLEVRQCYKRLTTG
jgi:hypothetical protein